MTEQRDFSSLKSNQSEFRQDIQGLRGLAVLAVVVYHAGLPIHGGFLGVDIFFVISGFVISQAIFNDVDSINGFKLTSFFSRRINRLIPLLAIVNIGIMLVALVAFSPFNGGIEQVTSAVRSSTGFYANAHFFFANNYLDLESNPVRHLWSLSVEEQFYFVFPFVVVGSLILDRKYGKMRGKFLILLLIVVAVASLAYCLYLTRASSSQMMARLAFFGTPFRAWEFLAGVLAQRIPPQRKPSPSKNFIPNFCGFFALAILVFVIYSTKLDSHFPSAFTVVPIASTAYLLFAGAKSQISYFALTNPLLVWLGDRSYGWYLWHWPIIVFVSATVSTSIKAKVMSVLIALILCAITFRFVEQRFRGHSALRKSFGILSVCAVLVVGTSFSIDAIAKTGLGIQTYGGWTSGERIDDAKLGSNPFVLRSLGSCYQQYNEQFDIEKVCDNGVKSGPLVLLVGDSQAQSVADGLYEAGRQLGIRVMGYGAGGCPMRSQSTLRYSSGCPAVQQFYLDLVERWRPELVIFANRYDDYAILGGVAGSDVRIPFADGRLPNGIGDQIDSIIQSLVEQIDAVDNLGSKVAVMIETPSVKLSTKTVLGRYHIFRTADFQDVDEHNRVRSEIIAKIRSKISSNTLLVDPTESLCPTFGECSESLDGKIAYWNSQHMNRIGSLKLVDLWKVVLNEAVTG
jgi:peptidoglycan/LPS O-acetylase OafA/YrhL